MASRTRGRNPARSDASCNHGGEAAADEPVGSGGQKNETANVADHMCTVGVALATGGIYYATMYRTLAGGDSGDLVASSCTLGVAHPPGYPLHTVLGALFVRLLPCGSPAWRVNMVSVVCGALASAQVFRASLLVLREGSEKMNTSSDDNTRSDRWAAVLGAVGGFAFSPLVWSYSTHAEVFALNNLLVATLVLLALQYCKVRQSYNEFCSSVNVDRRDGGSGGVSEKQKHHDDGTGIARASAFCIGLGISNQHTFVLTAIPAVCMALVKSSGALLRPRVVAQLVAAGLAGLSPYAYLVWAASRPPLGSWGQTNTVEGFLRHFFRREYGTLTLLPGLTSEHNRPTFMSVNHLYLQHLCQQTPAAWSSFAIVAGVVSCCRDAVSSAEERTSSASSSTASGLRGGLKSRSTAWRLAGGVQVIIMLVVYLAVFNSLANIPVDKDMYRGVLKRFWMQSQLLASVLVAPGARWLLHGLRVWPRPEAVGALVTAAVALQVAAHYGSCDRSASDVVEAYGRAFLWGMPPNSSLLVQGDINVHCIRYLQACEGVRTDIAFLDQVMMGMEWYPRQTMPHLVRRGIRFPSNSTLIGPTSEARKSKPSGYTWRQFLKLNALEKSSPIFCCGGWHGYPEKQNVKGYSAKVGIVGLCHRVMHDDWPMEVEEHVKMATHARRGLDLIKIPAYEQYGKDQWEHHVTLQVWEKRDEFGSNMLAMWDQFRHRPGLQAAVREYRDLTASCDVPTMPYSVWRQLGAALSYEAGLLQKDAAEASHGSPKRHEAAAELTQAAVSMQLESLSAFRRFLQRAPQADPDRKVIENHLAVAEAALHPA